MKKVFNSQVFNLWLSYQDIKFRFPQQQTISARDYQIVTACNPRSKLRSLKFNELRMEKLQRYLNRKNIAYQKLICGSPDFSWSEPSLAVTMPVEACVALARLYEQNAIYQVIDGQLWLVPVLIEGIKSVRLGQMKKFTLQVDIDSIRRANT